MRRKRLKRDGHKFIFHPMTHRELMLISEYRSDVITSAGVGEDSSECILQTL